MMAYLNGLDIASYQSGLDLTKIDYDFVIIKATQGTSYVNPYMTTHYQQAASEGKLIGFYHYFGGGDPKAEADYFLKYVRSYVGDVVLALDWESAQNSKFGSSDLTYCKTFLDYVYEQTGVRPMLYVQQSIMSKFSSLTDYGMWIAQYKDYSQTGYQETPWNEGSYTCAIRQYTSNGRLSGYSGDLDLDKFYGGKKAWKKYCNPSGEDTDDTEGGTTTATIDVQKVRDDAVDFAVQMANDNSHGYSQSTRSLYNITNPTSFDCSSLVLTAYYYAFEQQGITPTPKDLGCSYTGNMMDLLNCGFEIVARNQTAHAEMIKGDIELNVTYHTALAVDSDTIVHARSSEGTTNTKDDSGNEIRTQDWYLYSHGWDYRLRFTGAGLSGGTTSSTTGTTTSSDLDVDGEIGAKTVTKWQKVMGTTQDGFIDGQDSGQKKYWTSVISEACKWTGGYSPMVKAWQGYLIKEGILMRLMRRRW